MYVIYYPYSCDSPVLKVAASLQLLWIQLPVQVTFCQEFPFASHYNSYMFSSAPDAVWAAGLKHLAHHFLASESIWHLYTAWPFDVLPICLLVNYA